MGPRCVAMSSPKRIRSTPASAILPLARELHAQQPFDLVDEQFFHAAHVPRDLEDRALHPRNDGVPALLDSGDCFFEVGVTLLGPHVGQRILLELRQGLQVRREVNLAREVIEVAGDRRVTPFPNVDGVGDASRFDVPRVVRRRHGWPPADASALELEVAREVAGSDPLGQRLCEGWRRAELERNRVQLLAAEHAKNPLTWRHRSTPHHIVSIGR